MAARMQAIKENNRFKVSLINNHQYTILDDNNNNGAADSGEATQTSDIQIEYYDVTMIPITAPYFCQTVRLQTWQRLPLPIQRAHEMLQWPLQDE